MNNLFKNLTYISKKMIVIIVLIAFIMNMIIPPNAFAQSQLVLPQPGTMVNLSPAYMPAIVRGIKVFAENPLKFDFIVDKGDSGLSNEEIKKESTKLIKYFLTTLTVPEEDLWVNLSPYEKDRIVPNKFGETEMGRDLLSQDYLLKQITSSLMYPEKKLGQEFWDKVYEKALKEYGTTEIPVDTFNKVWIVPEKAVVYENGDTAFVAESKLKVMLDQDYAAMEEGGTRYEVRGTHKDKTRTTYHVPHTSNIASDIIREIIIPALEQEVNTGRNFAALRQIYNSMILATWYKRTLKESIFGKAYIGKNKVVGVEVEDKEIKQKIYDQYIESFKKGAYNYIKEDFDPVTQQIIPRKYFSGGVDVTNLNTDKAMVIVKDRSMVSKLKITAASLLIVGSLFTATPSFGETPYLADNQTASSSSQTEISESTRLILDLEKANIFVYEKNDEDHNRPKKIEGKLKDQIIRAGLKDCNKKFTYKNFQWTFKQRHQSVAFIFAKDGSLKEIYMIEPDDGQNIDVNETDINMPLRIKILKEWVDSGNPDLVEKALNLIKNSFIYSGYSGRLDEYNLVYLAKFYPEILESLYDYLDGHSYDSRQDELTELFFNGKAGFMSSPLRAFENLNKSSREIALKILQYVENNHSEEESDSFFKSLIGYDILENTAEGTNSREVLETFMETDTRDIRKDIEEAREDRITGIERLIENSELTLSYEDVPGKIGSYLAIFSGYNRMQTIQENYLEMMGETPEGRSKAYEYGNKAQEYLGKINRVIDAEGQNLSIGQLEEVRNTTKRMLDINGDIYAKGIYDKINSYMSIKQRSKDQAMAGEKEFNLFRKNHNNFNESIGIINIFGDSQQPILVNKEEAAKNLKKVLFEGLDKRNPDKRFEILKPIAKAFSKIYGYQLHLENLKEQKDYRNKKEKLASIVDGIVDEKQLTRPEKREIVREIQNILKTVPPEAFNVFLEKVAKNLKDYISIYTKEINSFSIADVQLVLDSDAIFQWSNYDADNFFKQPTLKVNLLSFAEDSLYGGKLDLRFSSQYLINKYFIHFMMGQLGELPLFLKTNQAFVEEVIFILWFMSNGRAGESYAGIDYYGPMSRFLDDNSKIKKLNEYFKSSRYKNSHSIYEKLFRKLLGVIRKGDHGRIVPDLTVRIQEIVQFISFNSSLSSRVNVPNMSDEETGLIEKYYALFTEWINLIGYSQKAEYIDLLQNIFLNNLEKDVKKEIKNNSPEDIDVEQALTRLSQEPEKAESQAISRINNKKTIEVNTVRTLAFAYLRKTINNAIKKVIINEKTYMFLIVLFGIMTIVFSDRDSMKPEGQVAPAQIEEKMDAESHSSGGQDQYNNQKKALVQRKVVRPVAQNRETVVKPLPKENNSWVSSSVEAPEGRQGKPSLRPSYGAASGMGSEQIIAEFEGELPSATFFKGGAIYPNVGYGGEFESADVKIGTRGSVGNFTGKSTNFKYHIISQEGRTSFYPYIYLNGYIDEDSISVQELDENGRPVGFPHSGFLENDTEISFYDDPGKNFEVKFSVLNYKEPLEISFDKGEFSIGEKRDFPEVFSDAILKYIEEASDKDIKTWFLDNIIDQDLSLEEKIDKIAESVKISEKLKLQTILFVVNKYTVYNGAEYKWNVVDTFGKAISSILSNDDKMRVTCDSLAKMLTYLGQRLNMKIAYVPIEPIVVKDNYVVKSGVPHAKVLVIIGDTPFFIETTSGVALEADIVRGSGGIAFEGEGKEISSEDDSNITFDYKVAKKIDKALDKIKEEKEREKREKDKKGKHNFYEYNLLHSDFNQFDDIIKLETQHTVEDASDLKDINGNPIHMSLSWLAFCFYGDPFNYVDIYEANKDLFKNRSENILRIGDKIIIPNAPEPIKYKVKKGDTLEGLVKDFYGSRLHYLRKFDPVERIKIFNHMTGDQLFEGKIIYIPMSESETLKRLTRKHQENAQNDSDKLGREAVTSDKAMKAANEQLAAKDEGLNKGGIDLNPNKLELQRKGGGIDFELPNVYFEELENATGFIPIIIQIIPVTSINMLLGEADLQETARDHG